MSDETPQTSGFGAATLSAAATAIVLGGGNAVAVKLALREIDPLWSAAIRFGLGAILFLGFVSVRRLGVLRGRALTGVLIFGVLVFGAAQGLGFWGIQRVEAGLAMVIFSMVPLITVLLAAAHGQEQVTARGVLGGLAAVAGFALMFFFGQPAGDSASIPGSFALLLGAIAIAESTVLIKKFPKVHPAVENGLGMIVGTALLLTMSFFVGETWAIPIEPTTLFSVAYMVLAGSVAVFALFLFVLSRWTATAAAYQFVLIPFVTFPAAAWLLGEEIRPVMLAGALLVLAGVYLGALRPARPSSDPVTPQCGPDLMIREPAPRAKTWAQGRR